MFKNLINGLVQTAFDIVGDLKETVTYKQFVEAGYDTNTSTPINVTNDVPDVQALFTRFTEEEKDDQVMVLKDWKVLIPATQLPITLGDVGEDTMLDSKGKEWNVRRYLGITGGSLHIFHVRAA
ncbi:hypothetical protein RWE87_13285 [Sinorhizobium meliloti]|uniref:hypothetical protein n=1 Tax=Rhizobium meliloti TaxID=382 RepID=UPI00299D350E|nr:hypothetical protein [Sinorhizobium meliloti]MDX0267613.1 hypothetical protein [Sinorhizobium meliloti]